MNARLVRELLHVPERPDLMRVFLPADLTWLAEKNRRFGYLDTAFYREWRRGI